MQVAGTTWHAQPWTPGGIWILLTHENCDNDNKHNILVSYSTCYLICTFNFFIFQVTHASLLISSYCFDRSTLQTKQPVGWRHERMETFGLCCPDALQLASVHKGLLSWLLIKACMAYLVFGLYQKCNLSQLDRGGGDAAMCPLKTGQRSLKGTNLTFKEKAHVVLFCNCASLTSIFEKEDD